MRFIGPSCTLGEGPLWHPLRQQLFWFDIPAGRLFVCDAMGTHQQYWDFGEPASAAGWIDADNLIVATASGLNNFNIGTGEWSNLCPLEADNPKTRSNDGRIGPDGSFWIGTMALDATPRAGAYYRYKSGKVERLVDDVSIPNATCFSPDGKTAYLADGSRQRVWRWSLNASGDPVGEREVHISLKGEDFYPDGAVCDSEGYLWNAQWGGSRLARYAPDGSLDQTIELPVSQPSCPAFGGEEMNLMFVTTAREGLSDESLEQQPDAGKVIVIEMDVTGLPEVQARI